MTRSLPLAACALVACLLAGVAGCKGAALAVDGGALPSDGGARDGGADGGDTQPGRCGELDPDGAFANAPQRWAAPLCDHICKEMEGACANDPYQATRDAGPFDRAACQSRCNAELVANPARAANWHCHLPSCQALYGCIDGPTRAVPPSCDALCEGANRCGLMQLLQYGTSKEFCRYLCAGDVAGNAAFGAQAACIGEKLRATCDVDGALSCFDFVGQQCVHVCGGVNGHHGSSCPQGTRYRSIFADAASCASACAALDGPTAAAVATCMETAGCDAVQPCWPPEPVADHPACGPFCDALLAACPTFAFPTPALCRAWCAQGTRKAPTFPDCHGGHVYECASPTDLLGCVPQAPPVDGGVPALCSALCADLECCALADPPTATCLAQCTSRVAAAPDVVASIADCAARAQSCAEIATCLPP